MISSYFQGLIILLISIMMTIFLIIFYKLLKCYCYPHVPDPLLIQFHGSIDGWTFSHLLYFTYLGFLFPTYIYELVLLGIFWELFEEGFGLLGILYPNNQLMKDCLEDYYHPGRWWYGKKEDLLANMIGLVIGLCLREFQSENFNQRISKL